MWGSSRSLFGEAKYVSKTVNINLILFVSSKAGDRNLSKVNGLERNPTKLARAGGTSGYSREKRGRIERVLKVNAKDLG